ncbi:MAG TPA: YdcF family protein [Burkholderiales bacterium]|nr:YdcF family protein [Burkholderiales bacterium]
MSWIAVHLISAFLLPPLNLILLGAAGLLLLGSRPRLGKRLIALSFFLLYLASAPFFSSWAMEKFEGHYVAPADGADAIVVLGGGSYLNAPEYGGNTVGLMTLERVRYAARLYRETGIPILVTGGAPLGNADSEAKQMKDVLVGDFHVPVEWTETASRNTEENASKSAIILGTKRRIYLVTSAWHMPRAEIIFRHAGFDVFPAPTGFTIPYRTNILSFLPSAGGLSRSALLIHEIIGVIWFELKSSYGHSRDKI